MAFCEIESFCQKVLQKHWPDIPIYGDIKELRGDMIGHVDIVAGGYPCQPFSTAGKRQGEKDDRHLWPEMFRIIFETRPNWVVCENVAGHVSMGLDEVLFDLDNINYSTQSFIIPAAGIGAPHRRNRVFIIANSQGTNEQRYDKTVNGDKQIFQIGRRIGENGGYWPIEPDVARVVYGLSGGMDRRRALGNAVVPQQIYPIFKAIMEIEGGITNVTKTQEKPQQ